MPEVRALIASVLQIPVDALRDDDSTETVDAWDSLKIVMLASMIEIHHDITLDNSEIERLTSVSAVREIIARHV